MTIYVDDGKAAKIYPVKAKVAKAVMTLLESDSKLVGSETHTGYGVAIVDKEEPEKEKVGHWIGDRCSECGERALLKPAGTIGEGLHMTFIYQDAYSNYCPNCGAKMSEDKTEKGLSYADGDTLQSAT